MAGARNPRIASKLRADISFFLFEGQLFIGACCLHGLLHEHSIYYVEPKFVFKQVELPRISRKPTSHDTSSEPDCGFVFVSKYNYVTGHEKDSWW